MTAKWMAWSVVAVLCLAPPAGLAQAQERPAPGPGAITEGPGEAPGELPDGAPGDPGGMDELDGLDLLLAADVAAGSGPGPGGAMGSGAGGMGPGGRGGPGMGRGPGGMGGEDLRAKLNLTEEQQSKLADIRDRQARAAIPIQADLRIAGLDLRKLMRADKPDQRAIDAQIDRIAGLRASLQKSHIAGMLEARAVLTLAQQKLLREHHSGLMGRGMRGGPGMRMMDDPLGRPRR